MRGYGFYDHPDSQDDQKDRDERKLMADEATDPCGEGDETHDDPEPARFEAEDASGGVESEQDLRIDFLGPFGLIILLFHGFPPY